MTLTFQSEAIPESLKNMLLVMDTAGIFETGDGKDSQLWRLTWDRIGTFLPHLKEELFKPAEPGKCTLSFQGTYVRYKVLRHISVSRSFWDHIFKNLLYSA